MGAAENWAERLYEPVGWNWDEGVDRAVAGCLAEAATYPEKDGLRGVFGFKAEGQAVVGQVRGDGVLIPLDLLGGLVGLQGVRHRDAGVYTREKIADGIVEQLDELVKGITGSGFFIPNAADTPVRCAVYSHAGVQAIRFQRFDQGVFGPDGQEPITHHLLSVAMQLRERFGLPKYLPDRNVLKGAW